MIHTRRMTLLLVTLAFGLALASLLVVALPSEADLVSITPLPPITEADGRAGACYSFYHDPPGGTERPYVQMAYDAGSRWDRFDFSWPVIEYENNKWNFGPHDALVNDLHGAGINMVGILLWTPDWAATQGVTGLDGRSFDQRPFGWYAPEPRESLTDQSAAAAAASSPPQGLYLAWNDPNNHWGNYVYTVVSRYGDRVKHWEMWNEPEWNYFWTGTSIDYAQLLKVGYQATKAACPKCTVLFGGLHYWANPDYYRWVLSQLSSDPAGSANNYFFDVMSVHLYSRSSTTYDIVNEIRAGMTTFNVGDHPIWLTETGVPVWNDGSVDPNPSKYDYAATQDEAAAYLIQSYADAWASGVERYFFFRTHDADMTEYFGLIRNDHSLRPSYTAYQVAATYLVSPTFVTRTPEKPFTRVTLWDTPIGRVDVVWNDSPTATVYTLPAAMGTATIVDRWGITSTVAATGGVYTLTLPVATANLVSNPADYIIGGDPLIVIESETLDELPTSTINSLPEIVYSTTFTVTWSGWDSESGVWAYDVQVRDGEGGEWEDWLALTPLTSGQFIGEHDHTYYFRCRAIDNVGNREAWPGQPQAHTTVDMSRVLYFSVGTFFGDEDRDGVFDPTEDALAGVTLRLLDESGQDVIPPTTSGAFTATIYAEQTYTVWMIGDDYLRALSFTGPWYEMAYTETYSEMALWPVTRVYLPLTMR
jgi:hypothetical protein